MTGDPVEPVLIVVDDAGLARLPDVVAELRAAGLRVDRVLGSIGTISGSAAPSAMGALRAVPGVEGVERPRPYLLPDPGGDVQ